MTAMRAFRWIGITVAVVVGLVVLAIAIGTLWLNSFIHSEAFRHEIEARAGQSLGGTVQIQSVNFDIFNGIKLQGLVTQIDPSRVNGQGALLANVESVNCTYAWKELLNRRLKLTGVTLDKPKFVLTKQPVAPASEPMPLGNVPAAPNAISSQPSGPIPGSAEPAPGTSPSTGSSGAAPAFQFVLDQAKINDGTVSVLNASGAKLVELLGVNVKADTAGYYSGQDLTATVKIADLALPSNMHVTDFSTPVTYGRGTLEAKPFEAAAYGGRIAGSYVLGPQGPSILDLNAKAFDVAQLTAATSSKSSAKLSGSLDVQSKWRGVESGTVVGEGDAQLTRGKLEGVKLLEDIGQIFRINELTAPAITQAVTHFQVANEVTTFTGLQLDSPAFKITGNGRVGFNGVVNADLVLILSKNTLGKLPKELTASFVTQPDGSGSIGFKVTGTTSKPETDLPARLLMQNTQIQNVINKALNKFFH